MELAVSCNSYESVSANLMTSFLSKLVLSKKKDLWCDSKEKYCNLSCYLTAQQPLILLHLHSEEFQSDLPTFVIHSSCSLYSQGGEPKPYSYDFLELYEKKCRKNPSKSFRIFFWKLDFFHFLKVNFKKTDFIS